MFRHFVCVFQCKQKKILFSLRKVWRSSHYWYLRLRFSVEDVTWRLSFTSVFWKIFWCEEDEELEEWMVDVFWPFLTPFVGGLSAIRENSWLRLFCGWPSVVWKVLVSYLEKMQLDEFAVDLAVRINNLPSCVSLVVLFSIIWRSTWYCRCLEAAHVIVDRWVLSECLLVQVLHALF